MIVVSLSWRHRAACAAPGADQSVFFGPTPEHPFDKAEREAKAKTVCAGCPVRLQCGNYAVRVPVMSGVWGGMGEAERASARKKWLRFNREQNRKAA